MGTKRKQWTFRTTAALVAWMFEEHLSEITLEDLDPLPPLPTDVGTLPVEVCFTWSLHGTGNGAVVPYRARAAGVRVWTLAGDRDGRAVSVISGGGPAVHVVMEVPGRLEFACTSIVITRGAATVPKRRRRPHTDYSYFLVSGPRAVTLAEVLDALGAPPSAEVVTRLSLTRASPLVAGMIGPLEISVGNATWIKIFCRLARGKSGHELSISRAAATDDEWRRAQDLPRRLGSSCVTSAWEFDGTPQEWAAAISG